MYKISVFELGKISNFIIVDIRNSYYYNIDHISGSINIPYYNLLNNYSHYLDKDNIYILYCDMGEQSDYIADMLNKLDYHVYSLEGGYSKYKKLENDI